MKNDAPPDLKLTSGMNNGMARHERMMKQIFDHFSPRCRSSFNHAQIEPK